MNRLRDETLRASVCVLLFRYYCYNLFIFYYYFETKKEAFLTRAGKKQIGLGARRRRRRRFKGQFISMHCRRSTQSVRHTYTHT